MILLLLLLFLLTLAALLIWLSCKSKDWSMNDQEVQYEAVFDFVLYNLNSYCLFKCSDQHYIIGQTTDLEKWIKTKLSTYG